MMLLRLMLFFPLMMMSKCDMKKYFWVSGLCNIFVSNNGKGKESDPTCWPTRRWPTRRPDRWPTRRWDRILYLYPNNYTVPFAQSKENVTCFLHNLRVSYAEFGEKQEIVSWDFLQGFMPGIQRINNGFTVQSIPVNSPWFLLVLPSTIR